MSKKITFTKQRIITDYYEVSIEEFVDKHFSSARRYRDVLDIYVNSGLNDGLLNRVMTLPLEPFKGIGIKEKDEVKVILKTYLNSEENIL